MGVAQAISPTVANRNHTAHGDRALSKNRPTNSARNGHSSYHVRFPACLGWCAIAGPWSSAAGSRLAARGSRLAPSGWRLAAGGSYLAEVVRLRVGTAA